MKYIKRLVLTMIPVVFLMGCSASNMKTKNVSKEAIERNTMTKVQSDVNVIMNKSDDYVLQNMGSPYSTIYSLKIDKVKNFEDLKKMVDKNMDDVEILSKGLLYIALKNNKVNEVETCDFKNLDVSSLMDEKANAVISAYTDYNSLSSENIKKEKLNKYIGEDKSSISSITKNKKCAYSIYMDVDGGVDIDIYSIKDSDFLVIAYKDNKITYIEQRDCTNIVSGIQQNIN